MIASYTTVTGAFSVLALLTDRSKEPVGESEAAAVAESIHTFVRSLALIAGFQGIVGVMLQARWRLGVLLLYQIVEMVTGCLVTVFRLIQACNRLARLQDAGKLLKVDCSTVRVEILMQFAMQTCLFSYLVFITWSLVKRLETGDLGTFEYGLELGNRTILEDALANSSNQRLLPANSNGPPPFAGAPRTLAESRVQQQTMQPFMGTPHRLE